jgi:hypothetical protein
MLKLDLSLFISTAAMLFYVVRYRIHLHVEYTPIRSRRHARRAQASRSPASRVGQVTPFVSGEADGVARDLESALVNLGASSKEARERASAAIAQGPGDFDTLILRAMQAGGDPARRNPRRTR